MNAQTASIPQQRAPNNQNPSDSRRSFFSKVCAAGAAVIASGSIFPKLTSGNHLENQAENVFHYNDTSRADKAFHIRLKAAQQQRTLPIPPHPDNGDEKQYYNKIGNFSKGLPHNRIGEVDIFAYNSMLYALYTGKPPDFERISMGSPVDQRRKLVNPQAALAFSLEGTDSHALAIPPAPKLNSAEAAAEMVEDYWMAICRDIPFNQYDSNPVAQSAVSELSSLSDFRGPKISGQVTPQTLFRVEVPGALEGPYISQFLWKVPPFGATNIDNKIITTTPDLNYMTRFDEWLKIQNGYTPTDSNQFETQRRYIRNGRDIGQWVHVDQLFQSYFQALLIMLSQPSDDPYVSGIGAPFNQGNPYLKSDNQIGFGTFGGENVLSMLCDIATKALKGVWFQKWSVHRRLRPEAYAGLVHLRKTCKIPYPIDHEVLDSNALQQIYLQYGSYLLPMAYPEGSPLHPSYGAGHATVAGACVTILKAWFDENYIIPNPVEATSDGLSLVEYSGPALTVGGELNKLATNIAIGRDHAGVHWRSDALASLYLGEAIAISVLKDQKLTYNEIFRGFTFTKFNGTIVNI
ncbi:MAG TPA: vanadium-dependent haloperoxidase [Chitinispirillaceae bacterium]|nr:vanadium-dependent haloperoxidase [Chitinispirillaceae bacterium]